MSIKKKENAPEMFLEKKEKNTDIQARMETSKAEIMKVVEGIPGADKLGELIELQGTGEGRSFTLTEQQDLVRLCAKGCKELLAVQRQILGSI